MQVHRLLFGSDSGLMPGRSHRPRHEKSNCRFLRSLSLRESSVGMTGLVGRPGVVQLFADAAHSLIRGL